MTLNRCFLDASFADDNTELGRIVVGKYSSPIVPLTCYSNIIIFPLLELRNDIVPRTCDNFLRLCTGENQYGLCYKNTTFNRIIPEFMVQCGKISGKFFFSNSF